MGHFINLTECTEISAEYPGQYVEFGFIKLKLAHGMRRSSEKIPICKQSIQLACYGLLRP